MARLTFARPVNFSWRGQNFKGAAGTVFRVDDSMRAQFRDELREVLPRISWVDEEADAAPLDDRIVALEAFKLAGDNGSIALVVAASDSSARDTALADYVCDGAADDVQIQAAIDALAATGGDVLLAPGTYTLAAGVAVTANKRMRLVGYGATLLLPASVSGIKVAQGVAQARGATIEGVVVDGQANASTVGIEFEDTNNARIRSVDVENCTTGLLFDSQANGKFVEGSFIHDLLIRDCTTGWASSVTSGTGSFAQTVARGVKITGATTGLSFVNGSIFQRGHIEATVWVATNQTAASIDCNIEDLVLDLAVEGAAASTGNVGLVIGTNATNADQAFIRLFFTGTIATQVTANSKNFHYWAGGSQMVESAGTATFGIKRHGDSTDRVRISGPTNGGKIELGNGTLLDSGFFRSAAAVIGVTSTLEFTEIAAPANGAANTGRLFVKDNGAGKTQLCVRFASGAEIVLATEA